MEDWKETRDCQGYKTYRPLPKPVEKYNELKIEVCYTKGGINYFSGSTNPRGYKLFLTPVSRSGAFESSTLMGTTAGKFVNIEEVNRFNRKRLLEHKERLSVHVDEIVKAFSEEDVSSLIAIAKGQAEAVSV